MSYKLYTDKNNKFQCTVQVEGTSLKNSQARVIIETSGDVCYMFRGKIYENGVCEFDVPKLKNILSEGDKGVLRMEVIADDVYFEPWSSDFQVKATKKVNVVVQEQVEEKPTMKVQVFEQKEEPKKEVVVEKPKPVIEESKPVKRVETPKKKDSGVTMTKEEFLRKLMGK